jgi:hypothetical protein
MLLQATLHFHLPSHTRFPSKPDWKKFLKTQPIEVYVTMSFSNNSNRLIALVLTSSKLRWRSLAIRAKNCWGSGSSKLCLFQQLFCPSIPQIKQDQ